MFCGYMFYNIFYVKSVFSSKIANYIDFLIYRQREK